MRLNRTYKAGLELVINPSPYLRELASEAWNSKTLDECTETIKMMRTILFPFKQHNTTFHHDRPFDQFPFYASSPSALAALVHKRHKWITEGQNYIDIGCGNGWVPLVLAFLFQQDPTKKVEGIDTDPTLINAAYCRLIDLKMRTGDSPFLSRGKGQDLVKDSKIDSYDRIYTWMPQPRDYAADFYLPIWDAMQHCCMWYEVWGPELEKVLKQHKRSYSIDWITVGAAIFTKQD